MPLSNPLNVSVAFPLTTSVSNAVIAASASASQVLMAGNSKRGSLTIFNDSTANLYIDFGKAASLTDFAVKITAGGYYELPVSYIGSIQGLWDGANGNARIRDLSYQ